MDLFSLQFVCFLAALLVIYYALGRFAPRVQWVALLVGSIVFYGITGGWAMLAFMVVTAVTTFAGSHKLAQLSAEAKAARKSAKDRDVKKAVKARYVRRRRWVLAAVFAVCLGMLGYLKYWNTILFNFGLATSTSSLGILLPLGISFYMFASLGYVIEVYNEKYTPEPSLVRFFLFVSWFPQVIQGPINRYAEISSQLFASRRPSLLGMRRGMLRLCYGLLKKYAIANVLVGNYRAIIAPADGSTSAPVVIIGILLYSFQMYADFSGGIDMVEGVSELFGIEMAQNFRQPYFSTSLANFWRRWHMSLGHWMKNYVFYPLAVCAPMRALNKHATKVLGKQTGRTISACVSNIIVFFVVGLWHGAELHFIAWGLYNGIMIALADLLAPVFERLGNKLHVNRSSAGFHVFAIARTFAVVAVGRYFDCIESVAVGLACLKASVTNFVPLASVQPQLAALGVTSVGTLGFEPIALWALAIVFVVDLLYERGHDVRSEVMGLRLPVRIALYLACGTIFAFSLSFSLGQGEAFMYANY
ncbi:MAG: MBOAT family protein [Atopobiaceae bacterium]|nr:MBOAT family protein [Atopobiaceae bacterium]